MTECSNCVYSLEVEEQLVCRRFPPVSFLSGEELISTFPHTDNDNWCGEWEEAE